MAFRDTASLQRIGAIADSASRLTRDKAVSQEVADCSRLIQLLCRDMQRLIDLRDESFATPHMSPQEARRVNDVINSISLVLEDVGRLLQKDQSRADAKHRKKLVPTVTRLVVNPESFISRVPKLQSLHKMVLDEISCLEQQRQAINPAMATADGPERQFENLHLLQSLMGGSRALKGTKTRSALYLATTSLTFPRNTASG